LIAIIPPSLFYQLPASKSDMLSQQQQFRPSMWQSKTLALILPFHSACHFRKISTIQLELNSFKLPNNGLEFDKSKHTENT